jgi:hypothetical protein
MSGVCGFNTRIEAEADEAYRVTLRITSDCGQIEQLAGQLTSVAALDEIRRPVNETTAQIVAAECRVHAACPVPCAIAKAIEVASGLALPADVCMTIRKG